MSGVQQKNYVFPSLTRLTSLTTLVKDAGKKRVVVTGDSEHFAVELKRNILDRTGGKLVRAIADRNAQKANDGAPTAHQESKVVKQKFAAHVRDEVHLRYGDEFAARILKGVNISPDHWVGVAQLQTIEDRIGGLPPASVKLSSDIHGNGLAMYGRDYNMLDDEQKARVSKEVGRRVVSRPDFKNGTITADTVTGILQDVMRDPQMQVNWLEKKEAAIRAKSEELKRGMPDEVRSKIDAKANALLDRMRHDETGPRTMTAASMAERLEAVAAPDVKAHNLQTIGAEFADRTKVFHKAAFGERAAGMTDGEIAKVVDDAVKSLSDADDPDMQYAKCLDRAATSRSFVAQIQYSMGMTTKAERNTGLS